MRRDGLRQVVTQAGCNLKAFLTNILLEFVQRVFGIQATCSQEKRAERTWCLVELPGLNSSLPPSLLNSVRWTHSPSEWAASSLSGFLSNGRQ